MPSTARPDLDHTVGRSRDRHAIVIGGSIAGLWAARVLAEHFDRVTVVERDAFPAGPEARKGVPQARHVHVLLTRGMRILDTLFPGLNSDLADDGAPEVDWARDCRAHFAADWGPRFTSGLISRTCSRALLEWRIRQRLADNGRITFLTEHDALGLLFDREHGRVDGVMLRRRDGTTGAAADALRGDFVVDAAGRDSRTPAWLTDLGYGATEETHVNSFLGYATRWYRRPSGQHTDWTAMVIGSRPPDLPRSGVLYPVEDDRWVVTLGGLSRDYPPQDEAGFLAFARSLADPALFDAIRAAEPLSPIYGYRRTENRLRHYERLPRWPAGFVALGDAVCAFNPVYGQGMTASGNAALLLDRHLRTARRRGVTAATIAATFQRGLAKLNATPWTLATSEDFRWPATEGGRPALPTRLTHRYMDHVLALSAEHVAVDRAFLEVLHLVKPPTTLFRPAILGRVLGRVLTAMAHKRGTWRGTVQVGSRRPS
jgi:flavin-dependent dehydrogenase